MDILLIYYQVYVEAQTGFRVQTGTVDNSVVLHGLINHMLYENKPLYIYYVDYTKAFDFVVRENICLKLFKVGVRAQY